MSPTTKPSNISRNEKIGISVIATLAICALSVIFYAGRKNARELQAQQAADASKTTAAVGHKSLNSRYHYEYVLVGGRRHIVFFDRETNMQCLADTTHTDASYQWACVQL